MDYVAVAANRIYQGIPGKMSYCHLPRAISKPVRVRVCCGNPTGARRDPFTSDHHRVSRFRPLGLPCCVTTLIYIVNEKEELTSNLSIKFRYGTVLVTDHAPLKK